MEQYIPKSALVAEIESRIKSLEECFNGKFPMSQSVKETEQDKGKLVAYKSILSFSDSLEVKEVDLERLINDYFTGWYFDSELDILAKPNNYSATIDDVKEIAKHFFELGLRASQPTTSVYGIEEALKENGIDPDSKEADMCREVIYKIYDRLQALKGE